jgi:hypothetical protein
MQVPNNSKGNLFEWTEESEELLNQILLHYQFDFEKA